MLIDLIETAHHISGAPGKVIGFYAGGVYRVRLDDGQTRTFNWLLNDDGQVDTTAKTRGQV